MRVDEKEIASKRQKQKTSVTAELLETGNSRAEADEVLVDAAIAYLEDKHQDGKLPLILAAYWKLEAGMEVKPEIESHLWFAWANQALAGVGHLARPLRQRIARQMCETTLASLQNDAEFKQDIEQVIAAEKKEKKEKPAPTPWSYTKCQLILSLIGNEPFTTEMVSDINHVKLKVKEKAEEKEDDQSADVCAKLLSYQISAPITPSQEDAGMKREVICVVEVAQEAKDKFFTAIKGKCKGFKVEELECFRSPRTQGKRIGEILEAAKKKVESASSKELFSKEHLEKLKTEYGKLDKVDPSQPTYEKMTKLLDGMDQEHLQQLAGAGIKFLSGLARNRVKSSAENFFEKKALENDFNGLVAEWKSKLPELFNAVMNSTMADRFQGGINDIEKLSTSDGKVCYFIEEPGHGWYFDEKGAVLGEEDAGFDVPEWEPYNKERGQMHNAATTIVGAANSSPISPNHEFKMTDYGATMNVEVKGHQAHIEWDAQGRRVWGLISPDEGLPKYGDKDGWEFEEPFRLDIAKMKQPEEVKKALQQEVEKQIDSFIRRFGDKDKVDAAAKELLGDHVEDYILDLGTTLLASAVANEVENEESEFHDMFHLFIRSQEDIVENVKAEASHHNMDLNQYIDRPAMEKIEKAINKNLAPVTLKELYEYDEHAAHGEVMRAVGHGVRADDEPEVRDWLEEKGAVHYDDQMPYFEEPYDKAYEFLRDLKEKGAEAEAAVAEQDLTKIPGEQCVNYNDATDQCEGAALEAEPESAPAQAAAETTLFANPYADAAGFYFKNMEEYNAGMQALQAKGAEEVEIDFIDGSSEDAQLFEACKISPPTLEKWFDEIELLDKHEKAALYFAAERGADLDEAIQKAKDNDYGVSQQNAKDYAYEFLKEQYGEIMDGPLGNYIDSEGYARDLEMNGDIDEFEFGGETWLATHANQ